MNLHEFLYKYVSCQFYINIYDIKNGEKVFEGDALEACDLLEDKGLEYAYKVSWIEPAYNYQNAITIKIEKY